MLFGVEAPKIIVNIDTTQDEVLLDYSVILKDEPELDTYGVKAVRTGKQVFTNAGKHWIFEVKIHLWKYGDPKAKYLELKSYEGTDVYLKRHSDSGYIYDTYDNKGVFILLSVNESYTDEVNKYDVLILTFRSKKYLKNNLWSAPVTHIYEPFTGNVFDTNLLESYMSSQSVSGEELLFTGTIGTNFHEHFNTKIISSLATDIQVVAKLRRTSSYAASTSRAMIGIKEDLTNTCQNYAGIGLYGVNHTIKTFYNYNNGGLVTEDILGTNDAEKFYKLIYDAKNETVKFYYSLDNQATWVLAKTLSVSGWKDKHFYPGIFATAANISNNSYAVDDITIDYIPI